MYTTQNSVFNIDVLMINSHNSWPTMNQSVTHMSHILIEKIDNTCIERKAIRSLNSLNIL
ncbi:hypothetical protein D3C76_1691820 [compost metagenome]